MPRSAQPSARHPFRIPDRKLRLPGVIRRPDGQISKSLSSPSDKNISLNLSGKSVV